LSLVFIIILFSVCIEVMKQGKTLLFSHCLEMLQVDRYCVSVPFKYWECYRLGMGVWEPT